VTERIKMLGICASPFKGGNTEIFLRESLQAAERLGFVDTDIVIAADLEIRDCDQDNWCMFKSYPGRYCSKNDGMTEIYPKVIEADAILFASPVYLARVCAKMAAILDRLRAFSFGRHRGVMKNKVGGALAVAWHRHGGIETTLLSILNSMYVLEMIPVGVHHAGAYFGAGAVSSLGGSGQGVGADHHLILQDEWGLKGGRDLAWRVAEVARMMKVGRKAMVKDGVEPHILSIAKMARDIYAARGEVLPQEVIEAKGWAKYPPIEPGEPSKAAPTRQI
jgi:multimeric flavodoxin WrbA